MSGGYSSSVISRLWTIVSLMMRDNGCSADKLYQKGDYVNSRNLIEDIARLRRAGYHIRFSRSKNRYYMTFPEQDRPLRLNQEQFFRIHYIAATLGADDKAMAAAHRRMSMCLTKETEPIHDCGPAYGIQQNITETIEPLIEGFSDAILKRKKTIFLYQALGREPALRIVRPLRLIHTPVSWYLVGYCEDRKDIRNFKLSRLKDLRVINDRFNEIEFNLEKHLDGAWWVRKGEEKQNVQVLFLNDAAQSIREYRFHKSQVLRDHPEGTLATWKLSELSEFTSWLLQWFGSFKVIAPDALTQELAKRISQGMSLLDTSIPDDKAVQDNHPVT